MESFDIFNSTIVIFLLVILIFDPLTNKLVNGLIILFLISIVVYYIFRRRNKGKKDNNKPKVSYGSGFGGIGED